MRTNINLDIKKSQQQQSKQFKKSDKISPLPFISQQQLIFPLPVLPYLNAAMQPYTGDIPSNVNRGIPSNLNTDIPKNVKSSGKRSISLKPNSNSYKKHVQWIDSIAQDNLEANQSQLHEQFSMPNSNLFTFNEKSHQFSSPTQNFQRLQHFSSPINRIDQKHAETPTPQKSIGRYQIDVSKLATIESENASLKRQASYYKNNYFAKQLENQRLMKSQEQLALKVQNLVRQNQKLQKNIQSLQAVQSKLSANGSNIIKLSLNGSRFDKDKGKQKEKEGDLLIRLSTPKNINRSIISDSDGKEAVEKEKQKFQSQSEEIYKLKGQLQKYRAQVYSSEGTISKLTRQVHYQRSQKEKLMRQNLQLRKEVESTAIIQEKYFKSSESLKYELQLVRMDLNRKQNEYLNLKTKMIEFQSKQIENQQQQTVKKAFQNERGERQRERNKLSRELFLQSSPQNKYKTISPEKFSTNIPQISVQTRLREMSHYYEQKIQLLEQEKLQSRRSNQYRDFQISQLNKLLMKKKEQLQVCYEQKLQLKKQLNHFRNSGISKSRSEFWMSGEQK